MNQVDALRVIQHATEAYAGHAWHARSDGVVWVPHPVLGKLRRAGLVEDGPDSVIWPYEDGTIILTEKGREACRVSSS